MNVKLAGVQSRNLMGHVINLDNATVCQILLDGNVINANKVM